MHKKIIDTHLKDYILLNKEKLKVKRFPSFWFIECPSCKNVIPFNPRLSFLNCLKCNKTLKIVDFVRLLETDKTNVDEEEIYTYLKNLLNIQVITPIEEKEIDKIFKFYSDNNFDLVPVANNEKYPIEKAWTQKTHKNIEEWKKWVANKLNIGIKTGKISGIIVIDIDTPDIPEKIKNVVDVNKILRQKTNKGWHLFFKYTDKLPKTRIEELKIDIETDGGQVVVFPSVINGVKRQIILGDLINIPDELINFFKDKTVVPLKTESEKIKEDIETENFHIDLDELNVKNLDGNRNNSFIKLAGVLRKQLNLAQTVWTLKTINKLLLKNPLPEREIVAMGREIDKYILSDKNELIDKILKYLKSAETASKSDLEAYLYGKKATGEERKRFEESLIYLIKEGYIIKSKRTYSIINKVEWRENLVNIGKPVDFKVPYFNDVAIFNWGDLILLGAKAKVGKTHLAMNIVKRLINEGVKPYYISTETGSRFSKIALQLGLKEGDFYWNFVADPTKIELEKGGVTIIDWLMIEDKATTDSIFKHFIEQLDKTQGFLIIFQQLKQDNSWFAENLCKQFPSLVARYIYDSNDGKLGSFVIDEVRERKGIIIKKIPCEYNFETKELRRLDE